MLEFSITNQTIERTDETGVVEDSVQYLGAQFAFSNDWDGYIKTALFDAEELKGEPFAVILDDGDACTVPWEVLQLSGKVTVSVLGNKGESVITTNAARFKVKAAGFDIGKAPGKPSPTAYAQMLDTVEQSKRLIEEAEGIAKQVQADAENGKFSVPPELRYEVKDGVLSISGPVTVVDGVAYIGDSGLAPKRDDSESGDIVGLHIGGKAYELRDEKAREQRGPSTEEVYQHVQEMLDELKDDVETVDVRGDYVTLADLESRELRVKAEPGDNPVNVTVLGKNLLDAESIVSGVVAKTIRNDSGTEVADNSSDYSAFFIRVKPNTTYTLTGVSGVQRVYYYDKGKTFLRRSNWQEDDVTSFKTGNNVYFVQFQRATWKWAVADEAQMNEGDASAYEPFHVSKVSIPAGGSDVVSVPAGSVVNVFSDDAQTFLVSYTEKVSNKKGTVTLAGAPGFPLWEPESTTADFDTPNTRSSVTCGLKYFDFLAAYYDKYLGRHDGYTVRKKPLGLDASGTLELYEYEFAPDGYTRTVLLSAGMNALELPGIFGIAYFLQNMIEAPHLDDGLAWLRANVRFKVLPIICPSEFNKDTLNYYNANGVNINRNFQYRANWANITSTKGQWNYKGEAPDSEAETRILKQWAAENRGADLWMDCHTDVGGTENGTAFVVTSDSEIVPTIQSVQAQILSYYQAAGNTTNGAKCFVTNPTQYPKQLWAWNECGLHAIMMEQWAIDTGHGGNGRNNSDADIKNYVLSIRAYVLALLGGSEQRVDIENTDLGLYHALYE